MIFSLGGRVRARSDIPAVDRIRGATGQITARQIPAIRTLSYPGLAGVDYPVRSWEPAVLGDYSMPRRSLMTGHAIRISHPAPTACT